MTRLLFLDDSYTQTFEAAVAAVDAENNGLVLDRTAFYPGGGGQPEIPEALVLKALYSRSREPERMLVRLYIFLKINFPQCRKVPA